MFSKVTLDQWRMFVAVVEQGSFKNAADHLHRSQSAVSHAIKKMEEGLTQPLFSINGRRAELTPLGHELLARAKYLIGEANSLEAMAQRYKSGRITELPIAVDMVFPPQILASVFEQFYLTFPKTRIKLYETVLSGAKELLSDGVVELGATIMLPVDILGDYLLDIEFVCAVSPSHPLASNKTKVTEQELKAYRQLVLRDSAHKQQLDYGWLAASERLTVTCLHTAIKLVEQGLCFAWLPKTHIEEALQSKLLVEVDLDKLAKRKATIEVGLTQKGQSNPQAQFFARALAQACEKCNFHG